MISVILVVLAAVANAVMDKYQFHYSSFAFRNWKWFAQDSWKNKWKNGNKEEGEKFLLSSTALVFLTDGWHFAQFLMLTLFSLAIVLYKPILGVIVDFVILKIVFSLTFELFFSRILERKN